MKVLIRSAVLFSIVWLTTALIGCGVTEPTQLPPPINKLL